MLSHKIGCSCKDCVSPHRIEPVKEITSEEIIEALNLSVIIINTKLTEACDLLERVVKETDILGEVNTETDERIRMFLLQR